MDECGIIFMCSNQGDFRSFVGAIRAGGGRDTAEDIMGGLNKAFSHLSWREEASKVIFTACIIFLLGTL
jgi:hypothetical protein